MGGDLDPTAPVPLHEVIRIPAYGEDGHEELKRQCFDLRISVFVHEQGFPLEVEIDQLRPFLSIPCTYPYPGPRTLRLGRTYLLDEVTMARTPLPLQSPSRYPDCSFPASSSSFTASSSCRQEGGTSADHRSDDAPFFTFGMKC